MLQVEVPKDIMKIKTTQIGPLTTRQLICAGIIFAVEYGVYKLLRVCGIGMTLDELVPLMIFIAAPIWAFTIEIYNMPLETFLKNVFVLGFLAPKRRPYVTNNLFSEVDKMPPKVKERNFTSKELRRHPDYIMYL